MSEQAYFEQFVGDEEVIDIGAIMARFIERLTVIMDEYDQDVNADT